jgi:hypothetical protein
MNKGYDYDGVITTGLFIPEPGDCIITGRTWSSAQRTYDDMRKRGFPYIPVYFMPPPWKERRDLEGLVETGRWKAKMIDATGVDEFFEDHPIQYQSILDNLIGDAKVIKVGL